MPFPDPSLTSFRAHGKPLKAVEQVLLHVGTVCVNLRTGVKSCAGPKPKALTRLDPLSWRGTMVRLKGQVPCMMREGQN